MSKEESAGVRGEPEARVAVDVESVLVREAGPFGRFQWRLLALAVLVSAAGGCSTAEYVFTTARTGTRCLIPECEVAGGAEFSPPWLANAVPPTGGAGGAGGALDNCRRYAPRSPNITDDATDSCPPSLFDPTLIVNCEQYVFEDTNTIIYDLDIPCDEWRRSLVGSVRTFGYLVALPITGFVSDRWGRRTALVFNAVNTAWLGAVRSWAGSYTGFVIGQFVEAALGAASLSCIYILLLELVGPQYRVVAGATNNSGHSLGHMLAALLAWCVPYWRHLTLVIFVPQLLFISLYWIAPESISWYQSKGKFIEAEKAFKKVARVNGKVLSDKTLSALKELAETKKEKHEDKKDDEPWLIVEVFRHKPILIRCLISPVWWITTTFVYYGLSINAVNMVGNRYFNYALVALVEIPGFYLGGLLMQRVGRRPVLAGGYWLCALCQVGYIFLPEDMFEVSLLIYLVGKSSIALVATTMYVYTTELYPTQHRHKLFAFSSMVGRIGAILAPLTPALGAVVFESLPFVLFGGMALLAGLLVLLTPETRGARMPDTMQQAARLGRKSSCDGGQ